MPDVLTLTVIFVILSALLAVIIRKVKKDKCLKDFKDHCITIEKRDGLNVKGKLFVASTGLELIYPGVQRDEAGNELGTFLFYKADFPDIQLMIRYLDDLKNGERAERIKDLEKTFHPSKTRRFFRKIMNFFRTIKDSILEIFNLLSNQVGKNTAAGMVMASQDKYINKIKNDLFSTVDNSFEPLLEKYIGYRVVLELNRTSGLYKYTGILKRYTSEFIELIDVEYKKPEERNDESAEQGEILEQIPDTEKVDLIVPRRYGVIRGLAEDINSLSMNNY